LRVDGATGINGNKCGQEKEIPAHPL